MKFGVIIFPGTSGDFDAYHAVRNVLRQPADKLWHTESNLSGYDCVILPSGSSYGDYLRPGAVARFSPIMVAVEKFAAAGKLVLGIGNGFQILLEAGLLPGAMRRNGSLQFRNDFINLKVENNRLPFTSQYREGQVLKMDIAHGEGNYYVDAVTLAEMRKNKQIVFRYCTPEGDITPAANSDGALANIAGICNRQGNVLGLMPHPERSVERIIGSEDGRLLFESILRHRKGRDNNG